MKFGHLFRKIFERIHRQFFRTKRWYYWNEWLFSVALNGMGIGNFQNQIVSGEDFLLRKLFSFWQEPTIIDVGAHHGEYSSLCMKLAPRAKLFAFEPHPASFAALSIAANQSNFRALQLGCDAENKSASLYDHEEKDGSPLASLYCNVISKMQCGKPVAHEIKLIRLDEFIISNELKVIHLLKIDTEGNELNVLRGLAQTLDAGTIKVIQFEVNEMNVASRVFVHELVELLSNYDCFRLLPNGLAPLRLYPTRYSEIFAYQNIVAIHSAETLVKQALLQ